MLQSRIQDKVNDLRNLKVTWHAVGQFLLQIQRWLITSALVMLWVFLLLAFLQNYIVDPLRSEIIGGIVGITFIVALCWYLLSQFNYAWGGPDERKDK